MSSYEISEKPRADSPRQHRRWLVIWNFLVDPREARHIALHTGLPVSITHNLVSVYNRLGLEAVELTKLEKRRRCYMGTAEKALINRDPLEITSMPLTGLCVCGSALL